MAEATEGFSKISVLLPVSACQQSMHQTSLVRDSLKCTFPVGMKTGGHLHVRDAGQPLANCRDALGYHTVSCGQAVQPLRSFLHTPAWWLDSYDSRCGAAAWTDFGFRSQNNKRDSTRQTSGHVCIRVALRACTTIPLNGL